MYACSIDMLARGGQHLLVLCSTVYCSVVACSATDQPTDRPTSRSADSAGVSFLFMLSDFCFARILSFVCLSTEMHVFVAYIQFWIKLLHVPFHRCSILHLQHVCRQFVCLAVVFRHHQCREADFNSLMINILIMLLIDDCRNWTFVVGNVSANYWFL